MPYADPVERREYAAAHYLRNRDKVLACRAKYREDNRDSCRERVKKWKQANPDKVKAQKERETERRCERNGRLRVAKKMDAHVKVWALWTRQQMILHDRHVVLFFSDHARRKRWKYRCDPEFRLKECIRRQVKKKSEAVPGLAELVRAAMLRSVNNATKTRLIQLVGYTMADLRVHLERQFKRGMAWSNYGKTGWHIDHILPRKCFDLTTMDGVRAYWALSNLRPLAAKANLVKGAKVESLL